MSVENNPKNKFFLLVKKKKNSLALFLTNLNTKNIFLYSKKKKKKKKISLARSIFQGPKSNELLIKLVWPNLKKNLKF